MQMRATAMLEEETARQMKQQQRSAASSSRIEGNSTEGEESESPGSSSTSQQPRATLQHRSLNKGHLDSLNKKNDRSSSGVFWNDEKAKLFIVQDFPLKNGHLSNLSSLLVSNSL